MTKLSRLVFWLENLLFFWCGLTLILIVGGSGLAVPSWIQVFGRLHPLILHFPIVILLMAAVYSWLSKNQWKNTGSLLLLIGSNLAGVTVVAGLILASEDYEGNSLSIHKWLGIISLLLSVLIYFLVKDSKNQLKVTTSALALSLVLTGHFGANLTHGEEFLLAPIMPQEQVTVSLDEAMVFQDMVEPILQAKCIACHKEGKIKGELRLDHIEGIQKGGKNGAFLEAGNTSASLFLQRIHLPEENEDHMPPKNKAQLTDEEIEILELWVASGASFEQKVLDIDPEEELFQLASSKFSSEKSYDFPVADESKVKDLNNFFRKVKPLYPESPALEVAYFGSSAFDPKSLSDLKSVKDQVVKINLNRMPLQGVDLGFLADFKNLEELQMNFANLEASQLKVLEKIPSLRSLAISGNNLTAEILPILENLDELKRLYLWQTTLSDSEKEKLKQTLAATIIDFGFDGKGMILALNPPKIDFEKTMFEDSALIKITHPIKSTQIRYTLDGTEPDSVNSLIFAKAFAIKETSTIRAKAFAPEWIGSEESKAILFKKGMSPESASLAFEPNPKYKAQGAETLFDGIKGKANHTSGEWLGYSEDAFEVTIRLKNQQTPKVLKASILVNESGYIFPPEAMDLWVGSGNSWTKVSVEKPIQSDKIKETRFDFISMYLPSDPFQEIKLRLKPISKLPDWHPGKGAKGWVFVDEIFLY